MKRILGYTVYGTTVTKDYPVNTVYVKLKHNDGISTLTTVMEVKQLDGQEVVRLKRSQPFYQYMRKDAFWPGTGFETPENTEPKWYGKRPWPQKEDGTYSTTTSKLSISETIQNPDLLWLWSGATNRNFWLSGSYTNPPSNLWSSSLTKTLNTGYAAFADTTVNGVLRGKVTHLYNVERFLLGTKTIYDPCPAGYIIPPQLFCTLTGGNYRLYYNSGYHPELSGKQFGRLGLNGNGIITYNHDAGEFTIFTDTTHFHTHILPETAQRTTSNADGRYITPDAFRFAVLQNAMFAESASLTPWWTSLGNYAYRYYSWSNGSKIVAGGWAVLAIDDSIGPDPSDFPSTGQPSGVYYTKSSSSLGRYTVMRTDPGF